MPNRFATRFPFLRRRFVHAIGAGLAVGSLGFAVLAGAGMLAGFSAAEPRVPAARVPVAHAGLTVSYAGLAVADVRARARGAGLTSPMAALPSVSRTMSETAFYAVVDNAVALAADGRLAAAFAQLDGDTLARERYCLAQAIFFEARSEGPLGKLAVAEVVLNRVADPRYPATVCGVVFQGSQLATGCQFSWTCDGLSDKPADNPAWRKSRALAAYAMLDVEWDRLTGDATHYHATYVEPYWAQSLEKTTQVGRHIFYRWHPPHLQSS